MKLCTKCGLSLLEDQFYADRQKRDGLSSSCKTCRAPYMKGSGLEASKRWKERNKDHIKMYKQSLRTGPKKRDPEAPLRAKRKWKKVHPELVRADRARRRAANYQAVAKWANNFFIQEAYRLARLRSKLFGFKWHVDHIVPLRSPVVCGLHVETNLQVIPASANFSKGNRLQWQSAI